ncbi:MAG TPA: multicopper oxidase domain-containing protein [Micromonosporaceae bacterium]|nr:multicopper oxidase domain-containing protein [Micromonosporaceae bacterium]
MRPEKRLETVFTRRAFLAGATVSGALLATGGAGVAGTTRVLAAGGGGAITRYPLYVPPAAGLSSAFTLSSRPGQVDLGGGRLSTAWVYNGSMPGPSFRARTGDVAQITLVNGLPQETITHWHGMIVDHPNDGHPVYAVPPGGTYTYSFPIRQRAAFNWYHPHPHMLTGQQVALGLAGAFIINDAEEDALGLPSGAYEVPLVVRDASLDTTGNLQYKPRSGGFLGDVPLVNGTRDAYLNVDTALYRFRVLGGANARIFGLTLSNGAAFTLIGNDGGLLASAVPVTRVDISPGERVDLLVDFRNLPVGTRVMLRDARAGWDLLELRVTRQVSDPTPVPTALSTITPLAGPVRTRTFSFDGMSKINGLEYDVNRIDFSVPFGEVELWRFLTSGNAPHPVHVHGASFQVVSRTGGRGRLFPWETGWKDTVLLEDRETVEVLIRFDAYRGEYLMHCHKLEHEDMGMMSNFVVV